ncbi:hypothetical protein ACJIZ3_007401 [Penstemon smallii]|uniref:Peptidase A1 domain-containing protein n=1 Tax=Penstemon smallii TaxID=265156 RepID=A0ABD3SAF0_9LAMI
MVTKLFISLFLALLSHCRCNNVLKSTGFSLNLVRTTLAENSSTDYLFPNAIAYGPNPTFLTVDVAIGTPGTVKRLSFDMTGSLTWTQCRPCIKYSPLTKFFKIYDNGEYKFKSTFPNGQSISGITSVENFSFFWKGALSTIMKGIVFGCANKYKPYDIRGQFFDRPSITGIMGMNRSPLSLVGQMGSKSLQRFTYCLPNLNDFSDKNATIRWGDAVIEKANLQKTNFMSSLYPLYGVNLLNISVDGHILSISKKFLPSSCKLDVGIQYSMIKREAYNEIFKALEKYFDGYNLTKVAYSPSTNTGLCYRLRQGFKEYPKMVLHFEGANFEIRRENLFLFMKDRFSYQMQNVRFIYDNGNGKLLFGKEDCSKDR